MSLNYRASGFILCVALKSMIIMMELLSLAETSGLGQINMSSTLKSSQPVPKNHRMDPNEAVPEVSNYRRSKQQLQDSLDRFDGYKTNQDFYNQYITGHNLFTPSDQIFTGSRQQITSSKQSKEESQQQDPKWSPAYVEETIHQDLRQSALSGSLYPTKAPIFPQIASFNLDLLNYSQPYTQTVFDDENYSNESHRSTEARETNEGSSRVSLNQAQKELEENLVVQNKLLSLLGRARRPIERSSNSGKPVKKVSEIVEPLKRTEERTLGPTYLGMALKPKGVWSNGSNQNDSSFGRYDTLKSSLYADDSVKFKSDELMSTTTVSYPQLVKFNSREEPTNSLDDEQSLNDNRGPQLQVYQNSKPIVSYPYDNAKFANYYKRQRLVSPSVGYETSALKKDPSEFDSPTELQPKSKHHSRVPAYYSTFYSEPGEPAIDFSPHQTGTDWFPAASQDSDDVVPTPTAIMHQQRNHKPRRPARPRDRHSSKHRQLFDVSYVSPMFGPMTSSSSVDSSDFHDGSQSHQVVHIHSKEKKGHGKYLWPIVGGGLTMLMGFLIISNMLLSIPLLAIGASSLFNNNGGYRTQQLVPVYNLSQITTRAPSGRRRRKRFARDRLEMKAAPVGGRDSEFEARIERLIDRLVGGVGASRLFAGWGLNRKQVLKAAYCRRPIRIGQQEIMVAS